MKNSYSGILGIQIFQKAVTPHLRGLFVLLAFIAWSITGVSGQSLTPQTTTATIKQTSFGVTQLTTAAWNTADGITYKQLPGTNLGATSFEVMDANRIAYLCNSTNEVVITDKTTGKATNRFPVCSDPRDFVYDMGKFYVLTDFAVNIYNESGLQASTIEYSKTYQGVMRLTRFNNSTYLLLPNGNSLQLEANGTAIQSRELEGHVTATGCRVFTKINGDNTYTVMLYSPDGKVSQRTFTADKKVAGVYVLGATADRVCIDVQTFISECPISVERKIQSVSINAAGLDKSLAEITVPNVYYVWSNKEFAVTPSGTLLNMVTAPEGLYVFTLTEKGTTAYPEFLTAKPYHFNDHLIHIEEN